jgi:WhiB family redox-sensing transcriptional regulator
MLNSLNNLSVYNPDNFKWQDDAACKEFPVTMFYYDHNERGEERERRERNALAVCKTCPVITACLQDAMDRNDTHSIQGGTTPTMRGHKLRSVPEYPVEVVRVEMEETNATKTSQVS